MKQEQRMFWKDSDESDEKLEKRFLAVRVDESSGGVWVEKVIYCSEWNPSVVAKRRKKSLHFNNV